MAKVWEKGHDLKKEVEDYTVGDDYRLEMLLLPYDIRVSKAHARMLFSEGYITEDELNKLLGALDDILDSFEEGKFRIKKEEEDSIGAIESRLISMIGEPGKKLHTARSRNDQALTTIRLYMIDKLKVIADRIGNLEESICAFAEKNQGVPMPGYTHMRKAMPTTVDTLASSYKWILSDDLVLLKSILDIFDKNPLGSAAGYGLPIKANRKITARELGFSVVQDNPIYCAHTRGKYESLALHVLFSIMQSLNRIASDLLLFSMPEFGFFKLPPDMCTGSSIMPQKMNPDVFELVRANSHVVRGNMLTVNGLILNITTGYQRDYQLTKGPLIESMEITCKSLDIISSVFDGLIVRKENLEIAMTDELYATEKAYELVKRGVPFREAYRRVAESFK